MKKTICLILAALFLLSGCQTAVSGTTDAPETTVAPTETTVPEITEPATIPQLPLGPQISGDGLWFQNPGKTRLTYTGNRSYVRYITSFEDLPEEAAQAGYDPEFFENYALLVVVETVNSGSVQLEIESIHVSDNVASVNLKRTMSGDVGTADMATWMLWVEVEKGLTCQWTLPGATQQPEHSKY